jgi:acetyltransferase-like isoleucine patch superfamily enzyme
MYLKPVYNHKFFAFLAQLRVTTPGQKKLFQTIAFFLKFRIVQIPLVILERIIAFVLILPIPVYSGLVYVFVKSVNGYFGFYIRALYYSMKAKKWGGNIIIDEDVVMEYISNYEIDEFVMIDKKVAIGCESLKIGKGVHIAMGVIIAKGGEVEMHDYSSVSYGSILVAATDTANKGYRTSGPMVPNEQRNVISGKIVLKKDSWITTNVVVLPYTVLEEGAVAYPGSVISRRLKAWTSEIVTFEKKYLEREKVKFNDPQY